MSYSSSNSHTYFTSGEPAPTAAEALAGSIIPNEEGWMAVTLDVDPIADDSSIELDATTEPPTLRLRNVGAKALWGDVTNGVFTPQSQPDAGYFVLTGDYNGAGSRLIAD